MTVVSHFIVNHIKCYSHSQFTVLTLKLKSEVCSLSIMCPHFHNPERFQTFLWILTKKVLSINITVWQPWPDSQISLAYLCVCQKLELVEFSGMRRGSYVYTLKHTQTREVKILVIMRKWRKLLHFTTTF